MADYSTTLYMNSLQQVLSKRYSKTTFCLHGYQENSTCLQYEDGKWIVFNAERGNRYDVSECDTILQACLVFIRHMTHRTEDISVMENDLISAVSTQREIA